MILYWMAGSLAAIGFYFYVVFPVWLAFAIFSVRSATTPREKEPARWLVVAVALWILFTVPLFFFLVLFVWFVFAAGIAAMALAPLVAHKFATSVPTSTDRAAIFPRLGLLTGLAVPVVVLAIAVLASLSRPSLEVGLVGEGLRAVALGIGVISGALFFQSVRSPSSAARS